MQLLHSRNSWTFSGGYAREIDFCIWVLEVDGLRVLPFDRHGEGDGSLRAAGLDAASWQAWLMQVVLLQYQQWQKQRQQPRHDPFDADAAQRDTWAWIMPEAHNPPVAWSGNEAVRTRLTELWKQFQPISGEHQKIDRRLSHKWRQQEVEQRVNLWQDLRPYHSRLLTLLTHTIYYPLPLNYLVLPVSALMTFSEREPDLAGYRMRLIDAAAGLAGNGQHRKRSSAATPYTLLDPSSLMYKIFPPSPMPPPPPRSNVPPINADPLKQFVLNELHELDYVYGEVDMGSVQFLREKAIPGWQLYYVAFEELDGHKHMRTFLLKQEEDGTWRFEGGSSGGNLIDALAHLGIVIHDHPIISINIGSVGSNGPDGPKFEFTAQGEIIDNGFNVARVRLISEVGDVFEDTPQDGLVLFAATPDHRVCWPMQAELYDDAGKLIWREAIDMGPPSWLKFRRPFGKT